MVNICNAGNGYLLSGICIRQDGLIFKADFYWSDDPDRALRFFEDEAMDTISFVMNVLSADLAPRLVLMPFDDDGEEG